MKHNNIFNKFIFVLVFLSLTLSCAVSKEKQRARNVKIIAKSLREKGWNIDSGSTSLELALYNHMETLERLKAAGKKITVIEGNVRMCRALSVCKLNALNNAMNEYVTMIGSSIEGKALNKIENNESEMSPEEFNRFFASYIKNIKGTVRRELQESYSLVKKNGTGKSYKIIFILDEEAAHEKRMKAIKRTLLEEKLSLEYKSWLEKISGI